MFWWVAFFVRLCSGFTSLIYSIPASSVLLSAFFLTLILFLVQEAFHVLVSPVQEYVQRWAVIQNTTTGLVGQPGDGTTIDLEEPFILR